MMNNKQIIDLGAYHNSTKPKLCLGFRGSSPLAASYYANSF